MSPPGPEGMSLSANLAEAMKPRVSAELAGQPMTPDAAEAQKTHQSFIEGLDLIFSQNPDIRTANPAILVAKDGPLKGKKPDDPEVVAEVAARKLKREALLQKDDVAQEAQFKDLPEGTDEEKAAKEKAVADEIARRQDLQNSADTLLSIEYAYTAANRAVEAKKAELAAKSPPEQLSELDEKTLREQTEVKYLTRGYRLIDDKGDPIEEQPAELDSTYKPVYKELVRIGLTKDAEGQPTSEAQQANKHLTSLRYDETTNDFKVMSTEEKKEMFDEELVDLVADKLDELVSEGSVITIDETTGKRKVNREILEQLDANEDVSNLAIILGSYYDENTTPDQKRNLTAFIYHAVSQIDAQTAAGLKGAQLFEVRQKMLIQIFQERYLEQSGFHASHVNFEDIFSNLMIASVCEGQLEIDKTTGHPILNEKASALLNARKADPKDRNIVLYLANNHAASLYLSNELGLDMDLLRDPSALKDGRFAKHYAERATRAIAAKHEKAGQKLEQVEIDSYVEVISHHLSDKSFMELAKNKGVNWNKIMVLGMVAMYALQILEGSLKEAETAGSQQQGGGQHG